MSEMQRYVNTRKVKYKLLANAFDVQYGPDFIRFMQERGVTIYLDTRVLFKAAYQFGHILKSDGIDETSQMLFASSIIGTIGHYRNFFAKAGIQTGVIVISESNLNREILKLDPDYKLDGYYKHLIIDGSNRISKLISLNADIAEKIVNGGIPHAVVFQNADGFETEFIPYLIHQDERLKNTVGLIITDSKPMLSNIIYDQMLGLVPTGNHFKLLGPANLIYHYHKKKRSDFKELWVSQTLTPHYLVLCGAVKFFKGVKGYGPKKTIEMLMNIMSRIGGNNWIDVTDFYNLVCEFNPTVDTDRLAKNLTIMNPVYHNGMIQVDRRVEIGSKLSTEYHRHDLSALITMNHELFKYDPLNIRMLFSGFKDKTNIGEVVMYADD